MKRFRFPLQPVAVVRGHEEARAREAFGLAVQAQAAAEVELQGARARTRAFEVALFDGRRGTFLAASEAEALAAYRRERDEEAAAEGRLVRCRQLLEQRRHEYLEAHRRLEVVRRLEVKARASHRLAFNREEQAEFDDFAGRRAAQRNEILAS